MRKQLIEAIIKTSDRVLDKHDIYELAISTDEELVEILLSNVNH